MSRHLVRMQISRHIHEYLIDAIDVYILWSNIFQVGLIDFGAYLNIMSHTGWGDDKIHTTGFLIHFEQSRTPTYAVCLQRRRDSQTDGFLRPAFISHDEVCGQGVKPPVHALH